MTCIVFYRQKIFLRPFAFRTAAGVSTAQNHKHKNERVHITYTFNVYMYIYIMLCFILGCM